MRLSGRKRPSFVQSWTPQQPVALPLILSASIAAFVGQLLLQFYSPGFVNDYLGLSDSGVHDACAWQFLTSTLLHTGPWHLATNLVILFLLGRDLQVILGQRHFTYLYLAGLIGGELGHLFLMPSSTVLMAASGGVAAIATAYATVLPELDLGSVRLFIVPLRLKAQHIAYAMFFFGLFFLLFGRFGVVGHSALLGGCAAGWLYVNVLGFGRTSLLQRFLQKRRDEALRFEQLSLAELMTEEIDPLLEKISRKGMTALSRKEWARLTKARERMLAAEIR